MSENSSITDPKTISELEKLIASKEEELEFIFTEIDELQQTNDDLHLQHSEIQNQISVLLRENKREEGLTKALAIERQSNVAPSVDPSLLETEHFDFLVAKQDSARKLSIDLDELTKKCSYQESELQAILNSNDETEQKIAKIEREIQSIASRGKTLQHEASIAKYNINQQMSMIGLTNKNINDIEAQIKEITGQIEKLQKDLPLIDNIQREIDTIRRDNEEIKDKIIRIQEETEEFQQDADTEVDRMKEKRNKAIDIIGWNAEEKSLTGELESVIKEDNELSSQLDVMLKENTKLKKRLEKLQPIHKKWASHLRNSKVPENNETNIDVLLKECAAKKKKQDKRSDNHKNRYQELINSNIELENQIRKRKEKLDIAVAAFASEAIKLKEQIRANRNITFEKERELINQILNVKVRMADI